jgi:hypothetical protein
LLFILSGKGLSVRYTDSGQPYFYKKALPEITMPLVEPAGSWIPGTASPTFSGVNHLDSDNAGDQKI